MVCSLQSLSPSVCHFKVQELTVGTADYNLKKKIGALN